MLKGADPGINPCTRKPSPTKCGGAGGTIVSSFFCDISLTSIRADHYRSLFNIIWVFNAFMSTKQRIKQAQNIFAF
jgi:hypothetical protein